MELFRLTAHELAELISKKEITVFDITKSMIDRIKDINGTINAYLSFDEEYCLERANELQEIIMKNSQNSKVAGLPIAIKDNICTSRMKTTCASKMLGNFIPPYNATVVDKIENDNMIIMGKLNMDEFAMGSSNENSYYGEVKNPWDTQRVPGGSSGGAAAAVASDSAIFALGSDTGGSIRQPASFCGVVGLKPTYGSVSRYGLVAFASSLDQIGPITKDVTDCALLMNTIYGYDDKDSTSLKHDFNNFEKSLVNDVKGMKIGIPKEYIQEGLNGEVRAAVLNAVKKFEELGAICEEFSFPLTEYAIPTYYIISSAEASSNLARYDGIKYGYRAEKFDDLIDLYSKTRSEGFGMEVKRRIMIGTYALSSGYYDAYYKKALKVRNLIRKSFIEAYNKFDAILGPTAPTTAYKIGEKINNPLEMYLGDIYTVSVNIAGLTSISLPCGFDSNKLPIGLQLIGNHLEESKILRMAYTFEQNTEYHLKKPDLIF